MFYVIGPDGILVDKVYEVGDLKNALDRLGHPPTAATASGR